MTAHTVRPGVPTWSPRRPAWSASPARSRTTSPRRHHGQLRGAGRDRTKRDDLAQARASLTTGPSRRPERRKRSPPWCASSPVPMAATSRGRRVHVNGGAYFQTRRTQLAKSPGSPSVPPAPGRSPPGLYAGTSFSAPFPSDLASSSLPHLFHPISSPHPSSPSHPPPPLPPPLSLPFPPSLLPLNSLLPLPLSSIPRHPLSPPPSILLSPPLLPPISFFPSPLPPSLALPLLSLPLPPLPLYPLIPSPLLSPHFPPPPPPPPPFFLGGRRWPGPRKC